jgi:ABC-type lipoprotein release transport system permease subunit
MFFTYLRRELRRRMRQAIFIALGLALGIGLVITVTAASSGVKDAQAQVLHSLYGVGTDVTVTQAPKAGSGGPFGFGATGRTGTRQRPASGTKINVNRLVSFSLGSLSSSSVTSIGKLNDVAAAAGGLSLTDMKISGKIPAINSSGNGSSSGGFPSGGGGGGSFRANFNTSSFTVEGVDLGTGEVGPLSSGKIKSGSTFSTSDATSNVAVLDANYAIQQKLKVGSTVDVGGTNFKVIGLVSVPQGSSPPNVYIPLARAQKLAGLSGKVNTIYVSANSAANISPVAKEISGLLPKATVTTSSSLASEVTGSLASAASLANNLGKWLAIAVLVAAFLLASLLTMAAVTRRVREFGTLKALGWPGRRIIGQVMGESIVIGIIGGVVGVALGFAGATMVKNLSGPLTASLGTTTGSATPGGAQTFGGGRFPGGGGGFGGGPGGFSRAAADAAHAVTVHLTAPVTIGAVILAVVLAIAGGLIAGTFGGWRAARLRPAAALSRVE